jgi:hypothetical protein
MRHRNAQCPCRALARFNCGTKRLMNFLKRRSKPFQQLPSGIRGRNASRGARQKSDAKTVFKGSNRMTDCGRRNRQFTRRPSETAMGSNSGQHSQLGKLISIHCSKI